jgi:O-antigen/teichoic acid export membrane protein
MRTILVNLLRLGGMQLVIALTAIVRNKVLALRLGPDGFGAFMQVSLIVLAASAVAAFGLAMSLNRNVAAAASDAERQRLLAQANAVNLLLAAVLLGVGLPLLLLRPDLLAGFGLDAEPRILWALLIVALIVPLEAAVQHRIAFLTGVLDIKGMTSGRSLALALGTAAGVPIVWFFGLPGAAAQLTLITLTILLFLDRRCRRIGYRPWALTFDLGVFRRLATLGVASLVAGFALQASDLVVRSALVRSTDMAQNGIYQAALSITYQVRAIVLGSIGSYAIASLSQETSREHVIETADQLLSAVLPIAAVALGLLGLLSGPVILVLYAPTFLPAQAILPILLAADFLHVAIWVVGAPLLALHRVRAWLLLELTYLGTRMLVSLALLPSSGITGVALGYAAGSVLHLLLTGGYYRLGFGFTIARRNVMLFVAGGAVVVVCSWMGARVTFDLPTYALGLTVLASFAAGALHLVVGLPQAWQQLRAYAGKRNPG